MKKQILNIVIVTILSIIALGVLGRLGVTNIAIDTTSTLVILLTSILNVFVYPYIEKKVV